MYRYSNRKNKFKAKIDIIPKLNKYKFIAAQTAKMNKNKFIAP